MRKKDGFGKKSKSSVTDTRCISDYFYLIIHAFGKKSKATVKIRGKNDYWAGPSFIWKIVGKKKGVENDDELLNWDPNRTSPRKHSGLQILKELSSSLGSCHFFFGTDTTLYERKIWGEIDFQLYTVGCFLEFY